ncbi:GTPase (plasmid) [Cyanobacterium sp. IPPAS B-1200]|uniref:GTPase n=1 Tax=Cyanobacterium sp. IPPAS B-1200 TaxID=1562720 RepID=UPI00085287AB|nr:GTPase [Cyanobacterium sp. IPPAS B-1200]OEJ78151.1 hypothetical protein A5482_14030 [Cyanobacterium sp. IPPAS B-1200]
MSNLKFTEKSETVNNVIKSSLSALSNYSYPEVQFLLEDYNNFWHEHHKQPKLTISFIGQYNAGKSTLIKSLTKDNAIIISPEICTDKVTEYRWNDVLLVDTPGIYAGRNDHDEITLDKISRSDLLVFVLPNELFNPQGAKFFQQVAENMQRVGQMMLVINKMSRETGEKSELLKTIQEIIKPNGHQDFYTCFIDANYYLKAHYEDEQDEKEFLLEESNFNSFLNSLETLIEKNKLSAKLITPLHKLSDLLTILSNDFGGEENISTNLLELLRRKENILKASQVRAKNIYVSALNQLEHEITMIGYKVAEKIDGYHKEDEINQEINSCDQEIRTLTETTINNINNDLKSELEDLQNKLQELEDSPLGKTIELELEEIKNNKNYNHESPNYDYTFGKFASKTFHSVGNFASKATRNFVYDTGKVLGVKFKPWGAFKMAKNIRMAAPILATVGVVFDIFTTVKEVSDQNKYEKKLQEARSEVGKNYADLAEEISNTYKVSIADSLDFYNEEIYDLNLKRNELIEDDTTKEKLMKEIKELLVKVKSEIGKLS